MIGYRTWGGTKEYCEQFLWLSSRGTSRRFDARTASIIRGLTEQISLSGLGIS